MNVANKELCKELYEVSGWKGTYLGFAQIYETEEWSIYEWGSSFGVDHWTPAYDLGYLLQALNKTGYIELRSHGNQQDSWTCVYEAHIDTGDTRELGHAESMEDAACKLAIELFKQGILKKEQS